MLEQRKPNMQGCSRAKQEEMLTTAVDAYNKKIAAFNNSNSNTGSFKVLLPYKPVGFTIPNTTAGIDRLTREQKMELRAAYNLPERAEYGDECLTNWILIALSLDKHTYQ